jgi:hypothetical protein
LQEDPPHLARCCDWRRPALVAYTVYADPIAAQLVRSNVGAGRATRARPAAPDGSGIALLTYTLVATNRGPGEAPLCALMGYAGIFSSPVTIIAADGSGVLGCLASGAYSSGVAVSQQGRVAAVYVSVNNNVVLRHTIALPPPIRPGVMLPLVRR